METVLQEATSTPTPAIPIQQGDGSQLDMLLDRITSPYVVHTIVFSFISITNQLPIFPYNIKKFTSSQEIRGTKIMDLGILPCINVG